MSKVLRTAAMVVGAVALVATGIGAAAGAGILGAGATGAAGTVAGISVGTISAVGTYGALAAGVLSMAAAPGYSAEGNPTTFTTNPQSGLPYAIGRTRMSGLRIYAKTYDGFKIQSKDDILAFVALLSIAGPIHSIEKFTADNEVVSFAADGNASGRFHNYMGQKLSLGPSSGSALALNFGGKTFPGWTANHKLSGIAHAQWALRFDSDGELYGAGAPEPAWVGKWVLVYDPRLDSTYPGGSGSCRALDESTYVWSDNPGLHALTWALGRWSNGKRVCGIGAPVSTIRVADFVECANVCEANGWKVGGVEWTTDSKWDTLKRMLQAGGAVPTQTGAMIGCLVSTPRTAIATIESRHLHDGLSIAASKSRRDRFNSVIPRYVDEDSDWAVVSGKVVSEPAYVTADRGQRTKEIDFPLVQVFSGDEATQPGQLAAYAIVNSREAGPFTWTTGPEWIGLKTGDVVYLNVPEEGLSNQPVLITRRSPDPSTGKVSFAGETETYSKHAYALGQSTTPPPPFAIEPPDLTPPAPVKELWSVAAATVGAGYPALLVTGTNEHPAADALLIRYRAFGDAEFSDAGKYPAPQIVRQVISPLAGNTSYEVAVAYEADGRAGPYTTLDPVITPADPIAAAIENFNGRNDRNGGSIIAPTISASGTAVDHVLNADGSASISFEWGWSGTESTIDGFEVLHYVSGSSSAYTPGADPANENIMVVPANRRAAFATGVPANLYHTFAVRAYRVVDPDIDAAGVIRSAWVKPSLAAENPYRPSANIAFLGDLNGTLDGMSIATVKTVANNFNARNDRLGTTPATPVIATGGTAVDHILNSNGSADISFEWTWTGTEATIDGFQILVMARGSSGAYTPGSDAANESIYTLRADKRSFFLLGVSPTLYYTFAVRAYRVVDPDVEAGGVIYSPWAKPSISEENPYRPSTSPVFTGDIFGTIEGVDATVIADAATNFNSRNDRLATTPVAPAIPGGGTAVDHTLNTDGSADVSFEWTWSGTEADIDGFEVLSLSRLSSATYTIGASPDLERVYAVPPHRRALVFYGVPSNLYYTLAVRAYRVVDADVAAGGRLYSAWVRPSAVNAENPYRPSANVAFTGDVAGTISTLPRMVPPGDLDVYVSYTGTMFAGQGPVTMQFKRMKGETDVSAAATWTIEDAWPSTAGLSLSVSSAGLVTFSPIAVYSPWFIVKSVHDGVSEYHTIKLNVIFAPPPQGIADYIVVPDTVDGAAITNSAAPGDLLFTTKVKAGAGGIINCRALFWAWAADGNTIPANQGQVRIRYRTAGSGSYIDGPVASASLYVYPNYPRKAYLGASGNITGLTANAEYDIQVYARRVTHPAWDGTAIRLTPASVVFLGQ